MSLTTNGSNKQLAWALTADAVTRPTAWYVALHTADPTEAGTVAELTTATAASYARQPVAMYSPAGNQTANDANITFNIGTLTGSATVTHMSIWSDDTSTSASDVWYYGALSTAKILSSSDTLTFAIEEIIITQD